MSTPIKLLSLISTACLLRTIAFDDKPVKFTVLGFFTACPIQIVIYTCMVTCLSRSVE